MIASRDNASIDSSEKSRNPERKKTMTGYIQEGLSPSCSISLQSLNSFVNTSTKAYLDITGKETSMNQLLWTGCLVPLSSLYAPRWLTEKRWPSSPSPVSTRESKSPHPVTSARCELGVVSSTTSFTHPLVLE